jgi:hypothetical protein
VGNTEDPHGRLTATLARPDAGRHAFYYVRVLEIPTPTWLAYGAKIFGVEMPDDAALVHQERADTSPIWYAPN